MGSLEAACIAGFLCRLCSEIHRTVIHIYSDQGLKHGLAKKINDYLPVTITPSDPLPKTICETCMMRVEQHHDMMLKVANGQAIASRNKKPSTAARSSTSTSAYSPGETNKRPANESSASNETSRQTRNVVACDDPQIYSDSGISNSNSADTNSSSYDL